MHACVLSLVVVCVLLPAAQVLAQPPEQAPPPRLQGPPPRAPLFGTGVLRLFLDCDHECDSEFIRRELTFVDHVRDSQSADIHALVATEQTGGGGSRWTIQFIGAGRLAGYSERVTFDTAQTDSPDVRRRALLKWLKAALATPAALAAGKADFDIVLPAQAPAAAAVAVDDRWNAWVFSLNTNGNRSGEARSSFSFVRFSASASRVTDAWKFSIGSNYNRNSSSFDVSDTSTVESLTTSWGANALAVKSLSGQWSAAARVTLNASTFSNYDLTVKAMAGAEYDVFPYAESTRRSLTVTYLAGIARYDFDDVTIFDRLTETKAEHQLGAGLGLRQPWGSVGFQSTFSQQIAAPSRNRFNVYGDADVRLFKGFSFNMFGDYSRIRDQINLRKGSASPEEVLLRQRQLATGFSYFFGFGVSYRFGSIYNNVVNPRFRNF